MAITTSKPFLPDDASAGFLEGPPDAERYENTSDDPDDVAAKIAGLISPGWKVLDVGCGTGSVSETVQRLSKCNLVGLEPDPRRVQMAFARGLTVFQGVLTTEFLDQHGPFDAIVFADVLEHLPSPGSVINLAKTGLRPGGAIIASVPNVAHWFVRFDLLFGRFIYQDSGIMDATHLRWFTRKSLCDFVGAFGLSVNAIDSTANVSLPDYRRKLPWRRLPVSMRSKLIKYLARNLPQLFGCQHVVRAVRP